MQTWLDQAVPVLAMIQAGELTHWRGESFPHAIVLIGYDATRVWLLDPAAATEAVVVAIDEFILAWSEMDYHYAVLYATG